MTGKTKLDLLVDRAIEVRRKLRRLEEGRKLTYESFLKEALAVAGCTKKEVQQLGEDLKTRPGTRHATALVRKLVKVLREPNYPRCPTDAAKVNRCYGSQEAVIELNNLGATLAMVLPFAVMEIKKRFGEDAFGEITDWSTHEKEATTLRGRLAKIAEEMKPVVCGLDLDFSTETLLPDERKRGLCRVSFRRSPSTVLSDEGWPERLIADAEAAVPEPKPRAPLPKKRKRQRLDEGAGAVT